ncbi:MAG: hypothetical protein IJW37_09610 [Lachnospiraceae bacterium]|nr:hypothetical protein [Lachnospiraceae bacterium]
MGTFIKKWSFVIFSVLLVFPSSFMGIFGVWILESLTGYTEVSYAISFMFFGCLSALPIFIKVAKSDTLSGWKKVFCIVLSGLLFSGIAFLLWHRVFGV